jgi:diguanylate cyclase (GGDEF)-like protein
LEKVIRTASHQSPHELSRETRRPTLSGSSRRSLWLLIAALVVAVGVAASVIAARSVAQGNAEEARQVFRRSTAEVTSTLQLAIQHQDDLVVNASGFVIGHPQTTQREFAEWAASTHVLDRYPEVLGFGFAMMVTADELPGFADDYLAGVAGTAAAGAGFDVLPPGDRPYYCLTKVSLARTPGIDPPGRDWCAGEELGQTNLTARDSGQAVYSPVVVGDEQLLSVNVPVYTRGEVPSTLSERRANFLGWVGTISIPHAALERALQGRPQMSISMSFSSTTSNAEFSTGSAPAGGQTMTTDLHNGWIIRTSGPAVDSALFLHDEAAALLLAGIVFSLLLAVLAYVLGTSRARALRLVDERTTELRHQALHDSLTGLPNRAMIMDRIEQMLVRNRHTGTSGSALYIDLDDFKNVNDTLGHAAGDRLLVEVATRLNSTLRDADTIGRMGGDEFVVLIDGSQVVTSPELVAQRLLDVMIEPFELAGAPMPIIVTTSIGIAVGDRASGGDLLRDADVALYRAKSNGKTRFEVFESQMHTELTRRVALAFDLRSALDDGQFHLVYQPFYNLHDLSLIGVEALLRWNHPTLGPIEPDEFVPILEQSGQILEVGRWVLLEACRQVAAWHACGDLLDLSVNVSGRQLDRDKILADVDHALETTGLRSTALIVEVTETALMHNAGATARRLRAIKDRGVRIAVDDFGTGYSSLAYLQQFPVDCLKIDRRFTNAMVSSPEATALVRMLVRLGRDLGLKTLAEGVETTAEMDQLRDEQVDMAQGFLLSRPLDPVTLERQLLAPSRPLGSDRTRGQRQR